jgi:hypothetical protein
LATTAGALIGLGLLGSFSIGLFLVAAGVLLGVAAVKTAAEDRRGWPFIPVLLGAIALVGAPTLVLWVA